MSEAFDMSAYNTVNATLACPRCGETSEMEVNLYFGRRDQISYALGDTYAWNEGRAVRNGGRPFAGTIGGEGYCECPRCRKDFFAIARVENDVLISVAPDPARRGYIPD